MVLAFGDHVLDLDRRELRRDGELVGVEPQVFDLLAYLVQHRDRVVSKEDMLQAVWGGRIVSDSALTTRINAVRKAIGDSGERQEVIRTIARRASGSSPRFASRRSGLLQRLRRRSSAQSGTGPNDG